MKSYSKVFFDRCNPDWAKAVANIEHAYAIELKPKVSLINPFVGFDYPQDELKQVGLEMFDGIVEYFKTFYAKRFDQHLIDECKVYYNDMLSNKYHQYDLFLTV